MLAVASPWSLTLSVSPACPPPSTDTAPAMSSSEFAVFPTLMVSAPPPPSMP